MKKRILTLLMALVMAASTLPVQAAESDFADIYDAGTATAVETLRLMGVLDGYGDGLFHPNDSLTRGQFCKMATYAMNAQSEMGLYRTVTVFPDVKPSHWASPYINLAAKGKAIIAGYPDGAFHPEDTVTVGQAVTILLRLLGYKDADVGGVWPASYVALGESIGLLDGVSTDGMAALTRTQAARLFVNLLQVETKGGSTLYTLTAETELSSLDGGSGKLKTADGKTYDMVHPVASTSLVGSRGRVVLAGEKALTFLTAGATSTGNANAAVIVYSDRSTAGFDALAGNGDYRIYKNGSLATAADLRRNDVAIYNPATNAILVSDTRVAVYYEGCTPNPDAPTQIRVLGGTELYVLPTAADSLAEFTPGDTMTVLLTADGRVAGASKSGIGSNAAAVVAADGTVSLVVGGELLPLAVKATEHAGEAVHIYASGRDNVRLATLSSDARGDLNVTKRTLGTKALAENVLVVSGGKTVGLGELGAATLAAGEIKYARTNWAGEVDLIVVASRAEEFYGRIFAQRVEKPVYDGSGNVTGTRMVDYYGVEYGNAATERTEALTSGYGVSRGDYVVAKINLGGTGFSLLEKLAAFENVSSSAWIGKTAVTVGSRTYTVPTNVLCYNADSAEWVTLDQAFAYSGTMDLYARDGVIRVIEVSR